jgi:hypothetical protein
MGENLKRKIKQTIKAGLIGIVFTAFPLFAWENAISNTKNSGEAQPTQAMRSQASSWALAGLSILPAAPGVICLGRAYRNLSELLKGNYSYTGFNPDYHNDCDSN